MAIRTKTIEYCFPTYNAVLASNTRFDFSAITVYIPETTSRTFLGFQVEVICQDVITATGGTITDRLIGLKLGAAAFSDYTDTTDDANSGENAAWHFLYNFKDYANTNFGAGSSQTCQVGVRWNHSTGTTTGMTNISARLIITYSYDDVATTQVKSVYIPLESSTGHITTGLTEIGINQIPALETWLPETGKNYRGIYLIMEGNQFNTGSAAAQNFLLCPALDSEAALTNVGRQETTLASSSYVRYIWDRTTGLAYDSGIAHAFKAKVMGTGAAHLFSGIQNRFSNLCAKMLVTYEYNEASSTGIMNSLLIPFNLGEAPVGGANANFSQDKLFQFYIQESGVALQQSAIQMFYSNPATAAISVAVGNQAYRTYSPITVANPYCGQLSLTHRFDAGGAQGTGLYLQRGLNNLNIRAFRTDTTSLGFAPDGLIHLNYTSQKHPSGSSVHNHTVTYPLAQRSGTLTATNDIPSGFSQIIIPEPFYYINSFGAGLYGNNNAASLMNVIFQARYDRDENYNFSGVTNLFANTVGSDGEVGIVYLFGDFGNLIKRHPLCIDYNCIKPNKANRLYRVLTPATLTTWAGNIFNTYHSITYPISGNISNYASNGAEIVVDMMKTSNNASLLEMTTSVGGVFTGIWYDNTENLYCVARQDSTHVGRSDNFTL